MDSSIPPCFYRLSVKALIHDEEGEFLLVKEANNLLELPGGGVEYEENLRDCLKREIREEMGLEITYIAEEPSYFFKSTNLKGMNIVNAKWLEDREKLAEGVRLTL